MAATPKPIKRANGTIVYRVQFRLHPGGSPTTETFDDIDAAWKFSHLVDQIGGEAARKMRDASDKSLHATPSLGEVLEQHLTGLEGSATKGTIDEYRRMANRTWMDRLGKLPIDQISVEMIEEWVAWQRRQPSQKGGKYSSKAIRNAHGLLSSIFETQARRKDGWVSYNPAKGVRIPSDDVVTQEMVIITPNDYATLIGHIPERWRTLVALLFGTGMRWGEATALTADDFDLDADVPVVRVNKAWKVDAQTRRYLGAPKTKRGRRSISLPPELVTLLRPLIEKRPEGLLWTAVRGEGPVRSQYFGNYVWKPAWEASGLKIRPRIYDLRHSHASYLLAQGEPVHVVQRRLGHEDARTTLNVYAHLMPDAALRVASVASGALSGAHPQLES